MVTTQQVRDWWLEYRCDYGTPTNIFGRSPIYTQNTSWIRALEQAHYGAGYQPTAGLNFGFCFNPTKWASSVPSHM